MKFRPVGVLQNDMMADFREKWIELIADENEYLAKKDVGVSDMQLFTVDMYTGREVADVEGALLVVEGTLPAQMELEAIFRARSRALAYFMTDHGAA